MEIALDGYFSCLSQEELENIQGGTVLAAVHTLSSAMGTTPLRAVVTCGGSFAAGVGIKVVTSVVTEKITEKIKSIIWGN